jgi:hypothetical protein
MKKRKYPIATAFEEVLNTGRLNNTCYDDEKCSGALLSN